MTKMQLRQSSFIIERFIELFSGVEKQYELMKWQDAGGGQSIFKNFQWSEHPDPIPTKNRFSLGSGWAYLQNGILEY